MDMEARAERLASARAFVAKLKGRSAIPGLSVMDAHEGTVARSAWRREALHL